MKNTSETIVKTIVKLLAEDALESMWYKSTTPQNYVEGGCSFCKIINGDCKECLLPDFFCKKIDGKLKHNTLVSIVRRARSFLLQSPFLYTRGFSGILFEKGVGLIVKSLEDLKNYGKVKRRTKSKVKKFINKYKNYCFLKI